MTKHHYVYKSFEEEGREYIGIRSCDCLPEEDIKYFGSFGDKTFNPTGKIILFTGETRQEVAEIEIELHDFFDVAVNPQFANKAKAVNTGFDVTGVPKTKEQKKAMSGENHPLFGVPHTEEWKKAHSERMTGKLVGEKNPQYGRTGALNPNSKAIIAIKPDGTQLHFGGVSEAARELGIGYGHLRKRYLKTGKSPKKGKFKGWQFFWEKPSYLPPQGPVGPCLCPL